MHLEIPAFGQQKTPILSGFFGNISFLCSYYGGPEGIRTLGLRVANAALSQLSYEPITNILKKQHTYLTQHCYFTTKHIKLQEFF